MLANFIQKLLGSDKWETSDRRGNLRAPVDISLDVIFPAFKVPGLALDLAPTGIRVRVPAEDGMISRGDTVQIRYHMDNWKGVHTLECRVRWLKKESDTYFALGLLFIEPPDAVAKSWVPEVLAEALQGQSDLNRKQVRAHSAIPAEFEWDGQKHTGRVLDISSSGALLDTDEMFAEGCVLDLTLQFAPPFEPLELEAVVCRGRATETGAMLGLAFIPGAKEKKFLQQLVRALITLQSVSKGKS